jgi:hypothetical protein
MLIPLKRPPDLLPAEFHLVKPEDCPGYTVNATGAHVPPVCATNVLESYCNSLPSGNTRCVMERSWSSGMAIGAWQTQLSGLLFMLISVQTGLGRFLTADPAVQLLPSSLHDFFVQHVRVESGLNKFASRQRQ